MQKYFRLFICAGFICILVSCASTVLSFKVEPTSHNFGQVNISVAATFDFVLTNKKSVSMTLDTISFTTGEFSEITGAQGKVITAKGTLTITVQFTPALPGGQKTDVMHIIWTDTNGKSGKKDVKLSGDAVPVPKFEAPTTYDFGTVGIGLTPTHDFNIQNTGTANLTLSLFNFNGNAALFSITAGGTTPVTITPGSTHTVTVQFAPVATGSFPTILEITHNGINVASPATINIAAAGGGGRIELDKTSPWDLGTVKQGASITGTVKVSNTGTINLNITGITLTTGTLFTKDSVKNSAGNPVTPPFAIAPSDFANITIKFSPTTTGNFNDTLNIANDGSYAASPAQLNLTGTGRAPIDQTFSYTGAIVNWNVPAGITSATIEAWGAQGGNPNGLGGKGARMKGDCTLTPGASLKVLVGQRGFNGSGYPTYDGGGGGGGSFVCSSSNQPIIIAGGGGGYCPYNAATTHDGRITTDGGDTYNNGGGDNGNGGGEGVTNGPASGGGGLLTDGQNSNSGGTGGKSFLNGGAGGAGYNAGYVGGNGGFGGGGGGWHNSIERCGGGGGYSGGQGGTCSGQASGGGGGSINNGTNQSNSPGIKTDNGQVVISY